MQKGTREKLALVLLGVFALIGVSAMAWYILVGHNWNVAASNIDDSIGQMSGYSVIVYEGTRPQLRDEGDTDSSAAATPLTDVWSVVADYQQKGADVFKVDLSDIDSREGPGVSRRGDRRLGFLTARNDELRSDIRADARHLERLNVDSVVAITDDATLGDLAGEGVVPGLSVIICDDPGGKSADGQYCGSSFCVSAPEVGQVGVVIMSPSGVYSSKTVEPGDDDDVGE